jgi:ABC-2 type transport system ATP-binding protein
VLSGIVNYQRPPHGERPRQTPALRVRGLHKAFTAPVVDDLDFEVAAGELYALLATNGAGKTTTLRMIAGLLPPDAGSIEIFGIDARSDPIAAKQITAWLPDEPMLYDKLSPLRISGVRRRPLGS